MFAYSRCVPCASLGCRCGGVCPFCHVDRSLCHPLGRRLVGLRARASAFANAEPSGMALAAGNATWAFRHHRPRVPRSSAGQATARAASGKRLLRHRCLCLRTQPGCVRPSTATCSCAPTTRMNFGTPPCMACRPRIRTGENETVGADARPSARTAHPNGTNKKSLAHCRPHQRPQLRRTRSAHRRPGRSGWRAHDRSSADAQRGRTRRRSCALPAGSSPFHEQANRVGQELCLTSRHRNRERAAAQ